MVSGVSRTLTEWSSAPSAPQRSTSCTSAPPSSVSDRRAPSRSLPAAIQIHAVSDRFAATSTFPSRQCSWPCSDHLPAVSGRSVAIGGGAELPDREEPRHRQHRSSACPVRGPRLDNGSTRSASASAGCGLRSFCFARAKAFSRSSNGGGPTSSRFSGSARRACGSAALHACPPRPAPQTILVRLIAAPIARSRSATRNSLQRRCACWHAGKPDFRAWRHHVRLSAAVGDDVMNARVFLTCSRMKFTPTLINSTASSALCHGGDTDAARAGLERHFTDTIAFE